MARIDFKALYYKPIQPDEVVNDYIVWLEICARMDKELAEAKLEWRQSVRYRDEITAVLKRQSDEARFRYMELEKRQKPKPPKRST